MTKGISEGIEVFIAIKSSQTKLAYVCALDRLAEFFRTHRKSRLFFTKVRSMRATDAMAFCAWLRAQPAPDGGTLSDATVSQRVYLLRRLCRYLVAIGAVDRNVFDAVIDDIPKRQRKQKRPTKLIKIADIERILELPDRRTLEGARDYCLLCLFFGGGLRRSEAWGLNVDDVVISDKGTLSIVIKHAKAGWNQTQSLPTWAAEAFTKLVSQRIGEGARPGEPLFTFYHVNGITRGRLSVQTIRRIYQRYTERVGLGKISPHSARASAATYLLSKGCSEISVADFLRHSNEQQVRVYDKRARTAETNPGLLINYKKESGSDPDC